MTRATENDDGIVWPDEEHLFAADNSSDERAVSQSSEGGIVLDGGTDQFTERNESNFAVTATDASDANEFWDHDDRTQHDSNLRYHTISESCSPQTWCSTWFCCCRSTSPKKYPLTEEEADVWRHDKFDLLKVWCITAFAASADCLCCTLPALLPLSQGKSCSCFCR